MKLNFALVTLAFVSGISFGGVESDPVVRQVLGLDGVAASRKVSGCANFSGSWKGECTVNHGTLVQKIKMESTIAQPSCDMIRMGTDVHLMGGSTTKSQRGPTGTLSVRSAHVVEQTEQPHWNDDFTVLHIPGVAWGHSLDSFKTSRSQLTFDTKYWLEDKTLKIEGVIEGTVFDGGKIIPMKSTRVCELK